MKDVQKELVRNLLSASIGYGRAGLAIFRGKAKTELTMQRHPHAEKMRDNRKKRYTTADKGKEVYNGR